MNKKNDSKIEWKQLILLIEVLSIRIKEGKCGN